MVPLQAVYIVANYKETQLTDVRPGQPVTIVVDTYPGAKVTGHIDSVAPASGQEFALLPPDNATRQFHQDRPAHPRQDRRRRRTTRWPTVAAPGHVRRADDRHEGRPGSARNPRERVMSADRQGRSAGPVEDLDRRGGCAAGRLHGSAGHHDRQLFAAVYRRRHRHRAASTEPGSRPPTSSGEIIVIPLTSFLSQVFSLRRYLLANVALFLLFSAL